MEYGERGVSAHPHSKKVLGLIPEWDVVPLHVFPLVYVGFLYNYHKCISGLFTLEAQPVAAAKDNQTPHLINVISFCNLLSNDKIKASSFNLVIKLKIKVKEEVLIRSMMGCGSKNVNWVVFFCYFNP